MDLTASELHPLTLRAVLDAQDPDWVEVEPQTLWELLGAVGPISGENKSKVQAVKTILAQPETIVDDWRIFNNVLLALNGLIPNFKYVEVPSYMELVGGGHVAVSMLGGVQVPLVLYRYAAAVAMFRNAPVLVDPFSPGDRFMTVRGENKQIVANALAYKMVLDKRVEAQSAQLAAGGI